MGTETVIGDGGSDEIKPDTGCTSEQWIEGHRDVTGTENGI